MISRTKISAAIFLTGWIGGFRPEFLPAATTVFFDSSQSTNIVASGTTSDTISSEGYLFILTRDKLFTGGVGLTNPIGRYLRVHWPDGLEAQAVTAGPNPSGAQITIKREDGEPFDIQSFTAQLLANTGGAGASFEIMPMIQGEDGLADPLIYDATGYAGQHFSYSTPPLVGFDAYKISLYVDFALMNLTVVDASPPRPALDILKIDETTLQLSWPANAAGYVLESTAGLPAQTWTRVASSTTTNGDVISVTLNVTGGRQFYRLRK